jgi:hypothetical protein
MPAAKVASALVFSKTYEKCPTFLASLDAITGMDTLFRMWFISSILKPLLSIVLSNADMKDLTCTKLLTGLCKLQSVYISSFSTAFYGAMIPADFGTQNLKLLVYNKLLDFSKVFLTLTQPLPNGRRYKLKIFPIENSLLRLGQFFTHQLPSSSYDWVKIDK